MATTVYTIQDAIKLALNDASAGLGQAGTWLSDANLDTIIMDRIVTSGTFILTRWDSANAWFGGPGHGGYGPGYALYFNNQSSPFAAEGAETYDIYARGLKVKLKTGSRTADSISIVGLLIDFDRVMADLCFTLFQQTAGQDSASVNGASISPAKQWLAAHEYWKGVITSVS